MSGRCPCNGCENERKAGHVMCKPCWFTVPTSLRDEVWRTYREHGAWADESVEARERAIECAEAALEKATA